MNWSQKEKFFEELEAFEEVEEKKNLLIASFSSTSSEKETLNFHFFNLKVIFFFFLCFNLKNKRKSAAERNYWLFGSKECFPVAVKERFLSKSC